MMHLKKHTTNQREAMPWSALNFLMVWKWHRTLISFAYQFEQNDQSPGENKQEVEWDERHYRQWLQIRCFWSKLNCLSDLAIVLTTVNCSPCSCNASSNSCTATTRTNHCLIRVADSIIQKTASYVASTERLHHARNSLLILFVKVVSTWHWFVWCYMLLAARR